jgi:hypothetical protein
VVVMYCPRKFSWRNLRKLPNPCFYSRFLNQDLNWILSEYGSRSTTDSNMRFDEISYQIGMIIIPRHKAQRSPKCSGFIGISVSHDYHTVPSVRCYVP